MPASDQVRAVVVDNKSPGKLVIAPAPIQPRGPNDVTVKLTAISQEHGKIEGNVSHIAVGTRLRIIPNHSCLTAAMFDAYHVIENGRIVDEWKPVRGW